MVPGQSAQPQAKPRSLGRMCSLSSATAGGAARAKDVLPGRTLGPVAPDQVASDGRLANARGGSFVVTSSHTHRSAASE